MIALTVGAAPNAWRIVALALILGGSVTGCGGSGGTKDDKVVAEWTIQHGGNVVIADGLNKIDSVKLLPAESFAVEKIDLNQVAPPITDKDLTDLPTVTGVKYFGLHSAQITDKGLQPLLELGSLQELELSYTEISDIGLQQLAGLKSLKKLFVYGTQVSAEGIEAFEKARPGCTVYRD